MDVLFNRMVRSRMDRFFELKEVGKGFCFLIFASEFMIVDLVFFSWTCRKKYIFSSNVSIYTFSNLEK